MIIGKFVGYRVADEKGALLLVCATTFACLLMALSRDFIWYRHKVFVAIHGGRKSYFFFVSFIFLLIFFVFCIWIVFTVSIPKYYTHAYGKPQEITLEVKKTKSSGTFTKRGGYFCERSVSLVDTNYFSKICKIDSNVFHKINVGDKLKIEGNGSEFGIFVKDIQIIN